MDALRAGSGDDVSAPQRSTSSFGIVGALVNARVLARRRAAVPALSLGAGLIPLLDRARVTSSGASSTRLPLDPLVAW